MADKEMEKRRQALKESLAETRVRIRRYSLDPRLKGAAGNLADQLRTQVDSAWKIWMENREQFVALPAAPSSADLNVIEKRWLELDRELDLVQRDLISEKSLHAGIWTVAWMILALFILTLFYMMMHGIRGFDFSSFEPWPEWGPLKYAEVACWSTFGVLCWLLYLATYYLARRDFDQWYQAWYVSTFIRAPFLTVILMMVVLEFVEWYGEGKWIQTAILEEGNKFYFIVFTSFCLGLASDATSGIMRDLSGGVAEFIRRAAGRLSEKLGRAVATGDLAKE